MAIPPCPTSDAQTQTLAPALVTPNPDPKNPTYPRNRLLWRRGCPYDMHNLCDALLVTAANRFQQRLQKLLLSLSAPGVRNDLHDDWRKRAFGSGVGMI